MRYATEQDLSAIVDIYNAAVPSRTATADLEPIEFESKRAWFNSHSPENYPLLVHEIDGKDYHFVDERTFESMIAKRHFLEWEKVHGNLYGTPRAEILAILQTGKDIILDIDVKGAINISGQCAAARLIFIEPPSVEELICRLSLRGEKEIETRMKRVEEEIARKGEFGYTIVNDDLEKAYGRFRKAIDDIRREDNGKNNC